MDRLLKKEEDFMLVKIGSICFIGIETLGICVEVNISSRGIPTFEIIGLGDKSVVESKHRIRAAFQNCHIAFFDKKVTVNLAPADIHKEGSLYDFPIAAALMAYLLNVPVPNDSLFLGEISLDGSLRHTKGALALSIFALNHGYKKIFVPVDCYNEACCIPGVVVYGVKDILSYRRYLETKDTKNLYTANTHSALSKDISICGDYENECQFENILGHKQLKRVLTVCAAGGHNLLMTGSPGCGKTLLAKSLMTILPPLTEHEAVEVTRIYSVLGKIVANQGLISTRPFRSPHHTISYAGLIGGGTGLLPGEITLAHRGVLFLDELNEFNRTVLESLRQPLEDGIITISRSKGGVTFPCRFIFVAAANPCPCGYYGDKNHVCKCSPKKIEQYKSKLSGPLLDRVDVHASVFPIEDDILINKCNKDNSMSSAEVRKIVIETRNIQYNRFKNECIFTNSEMSNVHIEKYCHLTAEAMNILSLSLNKFKYSVRSYFKIIKLAQTLADLSQSDIINTEHVSEALHYRFIE